MCTNGYTFVAALTFMSCGSSVNQIYFISTMYIIIMDFFVLKGELLNTRRFDILPSVSVACHIFVEYVCDLIYHVLHFM
jgi:hypothetical protein